MNNKEYYRQLQKIVNKIINFQSVHKIFSENDTILTGVSGGKDSLLLLEVFGELCKNHGLRLKIIPVHILVKGVGYTIDFKAIEQICQFYNFPFHLVETETEFDPQNKKGPCFICSWHRRKKLFSVAREMGCNKIALGHHMDDAVQTLLMNMIYHGSVSSMPAKLSMFGGELTLIRPLLVLNENEIIRYRDVRKYPELVKDCPYGNTTKRNTVKELISEIEKINPAAKLNLFRSMSHIYTSYLPEGESGIINGLNEIHPQGRNNS